MPPNSTTPILGDGTMMPGENLEHKENRELDDENHNPNLTQAEIDKYNSLGDVEFAGDAVAQPTGDTVTQPTSNSAAESVIGSQFQAGSPNLEGAKETLGANYIDGAATEVVDSPNGQANIASSEKGANSKAAGDAERLAVAAAATSVAASAQFDKIKNSLRAGDERAIAKSSEVLKNAERSQRLAASAAAAIAASGIEAPRSLVSVATTMQAAEMNTQTIKGVAEAKAEGESLSAEEREIANEAKEIAEAKGTDLDTEVERIKQEKAAEEQKKEENSENPEEPVAEQGIFG